jgi:hypothetical protein
MQSFGEIVYHGTPHDFDKFSLNKIGSGEGAQVYGWGIYFAQNPAVAKEYQKNLARETLFFDDQPIANSTEPFDEDALKAIEKLRKDVAERSRAGFVIENADDLNRVIDKAIYWMADAQRRDRWHDAAAWLSRNRSRLDVQRKGCLYEVEIPDDDELLDWDAKLDMQPPGVRDILRNNRKAWLPVRYMGVFHFDGESAARSVVAKMGFPQAWVWHTDEDRWWQVRVPAEDIKEAAASGEEFYHALVEFWGGRNTGGPKEASALLLRVGIPGLRYLDQFSRVGAQELLFDGKQPPLLPHGERSMKNELAFDAIIRASSRVKAPSRNYSMDLLLSRILHEAKQDDKAGEYYKDHLWDFEAAVDQLGARFSFSPIAKTYNYVIWDENRIKLVKKSC